MKNELLRRLSILENKKSPVVSARILRGGGMQGRLHRQEITRFNKEVSTKKRKIREKLEKLDRPIPEGGVSIQSVEVLEAFNEPIFRRIRKVEGFF